MMGNPYNLHSDYQSRYQHMQYQKINNFYEPTQYYNESGILSIIE